MKIQIDEDLKEIVPGFLANREKDMVELKAAVEANDIKTLERIGHKMAGSSGGYGFDDLGKMSKELELKAIDGDFDTCAGLVTKIEEHLASVEIEFVEMD